MLKREIIVTTAIILAGGFGTRLQPVVSDVPKPMAPIKGRPFLAYQLDYWISQKVTSFIISVGYKHEVIIDYFGNCYQGAKLDYVIESSPLGTGGGLLLAIQKIENEISFLLLNGDTYFAVALQNLISFAHKNDADWCFSLFSTSDKERYLGMNVLPDGKVIALKSKESSLANGGVYWIKRRALLDQWLYSHRKYSRFGLGPTNMTIRKLSLEDDILPMVLSSGQRLFGIEFSGKFIDIGLPKDYHRSAKFIA